VIQEGNASVQYESGIGTKTTGGLSQPGVLLTRVREKTVGSKMRGRGRGESNHKLSCTWSPEMDGLIGKNLLGVRGSAGEQCP